MILISELLSVPQQVYLPADECWELALTLGPFQSKSRWPRKQAPVKRKPTHKMGPSLINLVLWLWSVLTATMVAGYLYLIGQEWKWNLTACHVFNSRGTCAQYCGSREKTTLASAYRWRLDLEQSSRLIENSIQLSKRNCQGRVLELYPARWPSYHTRLRTLWES